jgi:phospholipase A-2-activating protein
MYAIPAEAASQGLPFKKENLPGPGTCCCIQSFTADLSWLTDVSTDILQTKIGDQDGQQLFILEPDGSVTAYLWSLSTGKWNMVCWCRNVPGTVALH